MRADGFDELGVLERVGQLDFKAFEQFGEGLFPLREERAGLATAETGPVRANLCVGSSAFMPSEGLAHW